MLTSLMSYDSSNNLSNEQRAVRTFSRVSIQAAPDICPPRLFAKWLLAGCNYDYQSQNRWIHFARIFCKLNPVSYSGSQNGPKGLLNANQAHLWESTTFLYHTHGYGRGDGSRVRLMPKLNPMVTTQVLAEMDRVRQGDISPELLPRRFTDYRLHDGSLLTAHVLLDRGYKPSCEIPNS
ncbi:predicted protein [Histoplasma capsulatum G186AR]|uniref:Uncharacterized protein n=1 Tax=Ajellomyces capsulatus (strain G186AR / H82 / ATCC MYA-2454 / RMSCC 2432) TaxID=447093 RepID=C0NTF4_AJECG|nr:uncharacterized protein HCBG_06434 [Histoplasma capsulatum G186AR]EEH05315.1 predicted protein [Histoplasma capsulatum G186AR]